jgi:hypothetical protein
MRSIEGGKGQEEPMEGQTLAQLRKGLPDGQRKIVGAVIAQIERELIDILPELNAGVQASAASGSATFTLQIARARKGRFKAEIAARVRTPREKLELDMHVGTDGQLSLGLPAGWIEGEGNEGEE